MHKVTWFLMIIAVLMVFNCQPAPAAEEQAKAVKNFGFPLDPGWQWEYSYVSQEQSADGKTLVDAYGSHDGTKVKVDEVKATLKLEVQSVSINETGISAKIVGNGLLPWPSTEKIVDYCFVIENKTGCLFVGGDALAESFNKNTLDTDSQYMIMILPPKVGQHWGGDDSVKRTDTWYRWQVEAKETVTVPAGTFKCTRLALRTCPDHQLIWFSPGVGIVKMEYVHHGTIINAFVELTSYGQKKQ